MNIAEKIEESYKESKNYPELVGKLIGLGVLNYTVDVNTGLTLFRFADGVTFLNRAHISNRKVNENFSREATFMAVKNTQQGKTTYPEFMDEIAAAGVKFYEATLSGKKRVTYIGAQGEYEEEIPF